MSFSDYLLPRDSNEFLVSSLNRGRIWILDVDSDWKYEVVINDTGDTSRPSPLSNQITAIVYDIISPTNWILKGKCKNIKCFGDWNNDGFEDFMFFDGEVILAVPEPAMLYFALMSFTFFLRYKRN